MGLLNKTECAEAGVPPAGCGVGGARLTASSAAHAERLHPLGAPCVLGPF